MCACVGEELRWGGLGGVVGGQRGACASECEMCMPMCVCVCVHVGRVTRPFVTQGGPLNGEVRDLHTDGGSEVARDYTSALSPLQSQCFHSLALFVVLWRRRRGEEKETVGGISVKLGG